HQCVSPVCHVSRSRISNSRTELHVADRPAGGPPRAEDFSLAVAGPVYRLLERLGGGVHPLPHVAPRIAVLGMPTWGPLLLLTASEGTAVGGLVSLPLLRDFSIYGRFLLGIPLLVVAETFVDPALRTVLREFSEGRFLHDNDRPAMDDIIADATRLTNS